MYKNIPQHASELGATPKEKEFAPFKSKFFSLREAPMTKEKNVHVFMLDDSLLQIFSLSYIYYKYVHFAYVILRWLSSTYHSWGAQKVW